jgi:hypothetical protein
MNKHVKRNFGPRYLLPILLFLFASLACQAVTGFVLDAHQPNIPEAPVPTQPEATVTVTVAATQETPAIETASCPPVTDKILETATHFYDEGSGDEKHAGSEERYLVTYSVSGDQISNPLYEEVPSDLLAFQEDTASQQAIWDYFTTLIPSGERTSLAEYSVVTDGEGNLLAAVAQTSYDPALWTLEVDIRDAGDRLNLTYTLIHEYAHLLTLGPEQVMPSVAVFTHPDNGDIFSDEVNACPDYFPGEGCSRSDSYINTFFTAFWTDIYEEWQDINLIEKDEAYYRALDAFYDKYRDRFVTDYAATDPEEDIAESFTFFVLSPRPKGDTIAEQKTLFFYQYPELVRLRDEILHGLCRLNQ